MEIDNHNFVLRIPFEKGQFLLSCLGGCTSTLIYLIIAAVLDKITGNYSLANMIALLIAILIGYVIQNGIFTLHLSKSQQDSVNSDKYKFSRYLISELIGFVIHQAIFIQLLRLPVYFPIPIQNTLLRMVSSTVVFFLLFGLRKHWIFVEK